MNIGKLFHRASVSILTFDKVRNEERRLLDRIWNARGVKGKGKGSKKISLAFSGGGIRSATFNLGVLQALAKKGLLNSVEYLSSVSGGGYINSWLTALSSQVGFDKAVDALKTIGGPKEHPAIRHLRQFSNYLTPKVGLLSADTWTLVATYTRNLLLNLLIITLTLAGALLLPRAMSGLLAAFSDLDPSLLLVISGIFLVLPIGFISYNLVSIDEKRLKSDYPFFKEQRGVQWAIVAPVFIASVFLSLWLKTNGVAFSSSWNAIWQGGLVYVVAWSVGWIIYVLFFRSSATERKSFAEIGGAFLVLLISGGVGGILFQVAFKHALRPIIELQYLDGNLFYLAAPVIIVFVFSLVLVLHIGLAGRGTTDDMREWWSRLGAWFIIYCIAWLGLWASTFALPWALSRLQLGDWTKAGVVLGWIATTVAGVLAGKGDETGGKAQKLAKEFIAKIAPFVFVVGFIAILSWAIQRETLVGSRSENLYLYTLAQSSGMDAARYYLVLAAGLLVIAYGLAKTVDVNEFSMHAMYRNRLVRCYLGASNRKRNQHPFTGLDRTDDLPLQSILSGTDEEGRPYSGPFPIFNTTLNISSTERLDWQQRKARPFSFSPAAFGFAENNVPLKDQAPLTVGSVMAMSGAAVSSNMGYHTSTVISFLITLFNVRLGQWFFNPRKLKSGDKSPNLSLFYLFFELFGLTKETSRYVYLSDGGHFENLGLYELVRRKCDLIIVSDGGADGGYTFADLGNAIEKCRVDLGVKIELLDVEKMKPGDSGFSKKQFIKGKIRYKKKTGRLIYMKASLSGHEPTDVLAYKAKHKDFPHQSTGDQWFDEAQFEAYRALGYHIATDLKINR